MKRNYFLSYSHIAFCPIGMLTALNTGSTRLNPSPLFQWVNPLFSCSVRSGIPHPKSLNTYSLFSISRYVFTDIRNHVNQEMSYPFFYGNADHSGINMHLEFSSDHGPEPSAMHLYAECPSETTGYFNHRAFLKLPLPQLSALPAWV
ncbi:hypothetical protein J2780_003293 [Chryseobacterium camelliae]|nr:hypothetical protein [Chryseobacterium camelliae]